MTRGDLFRVARVSGDHLKRFRVFVIVSRQVVVDSKLSTVICAPVYAGRHGLSTEVPVGPDDGLRQASSVQCDALVSLPKAVLTQRLGRLRPSRLDEIDRALAVALALIDSPA